jgi:hypothetical protein
MISPDRKLGGYIELDAESYEMLVWTAAIWRIWRISRRPEIETKLRLVRPYDETTSNDNTYITSIIDM